MKICEFCNAQNADNAVKCVSCGGTSFKYKCDNCGTEFKEGNFCPKCGVKAGQEPRICPVCNTQYYSNACPTCGYIPNATQQAPPTPEYYYAPQPVTPPAPKRKTWLWVLGWIFIFPVPLMLILLKKQNMKKGLKIGIIIAAWVVYALMLIVGAANDNEEPYPKEDFPPRETAVASTAETEVPTEKETEAPTESKSEAPTEAPTKAPTEAPTENPTEAPTEAPTPITFTEYTNSVDAGAEAFVRIQGAPYTEYTIAVTYKSGSNAQGLEPQTTDANGYTTWTWKVGTNTTPGEHDITVSGGGTTNRTTFTVN